MKRIRDKDILALIGAVRALDKSTSPKMLRANLDFLWDRYIAHPNKSLARPITARLNRKPRNAPAVTAGETALIYETRSTTNSHCGSVWLE